MEFVIMGKLKDTDGGLNTVNANPAEPAGEAQAETAVELTPEQIVSKRVRHLRRAVIGANAAKQRVLKSAEARLDAIDKTATAMRSRLVLAGEIELRLALGEAVTAGEMEAIMSDEIADDDGE